MVQFMNVAFGLRAHSGWAALVVPGKQRDELVVIGKIRWKSMGQRPEGRCSRRVHGTATSLATMKYAVRQPFSGYSFEANMNKGVIDFESDSVARLYT